MSEKPINQSGNHDQGKSEQEVKRSPVDHPSNASWQPLEAKPPAVEDLASILQAEYTDPRAGEEANKQISSLPSSQVTSISPNNLQDQPSTPPYQETDLAELAATVFDTTFYLVPRSNEHYLLGDLAQQLRVWLPGLCELYGWELNFLSIRPDYLKWTLLDFPECLTQKMLAVVRQWTSTHIFQFFPALQTGVPDLDFWSSGYLVDTFNQDFPTQELIAQVSRNRG